MIIYFYTLNHPVSGVPLYVGSTEDSITRESNHRWAIKNSTAPVYKYCRDNGIVPLFEVLEVAEVESKPQRLSVENYWIEQLRAWGFVLLNVVTHKNPFARLDSKYETIKVSADTLKKIREYKDEAGLTIAEFVEMAVEDKLKLDKQVREILKSKKVR